MEELKSLADDDVFLPTATDYEAVRKELSVLVARVLVQHVPCLRTLQNIVPSHIIHKHSADTAKASITVSVWKSTSAGWNEPFVHCYVCYDSLSISSMIRSRYCAVLQVPLGVLLKNENRTEDMIEILGHAQQYVPTIEGRLQNIFFGGDQLTCERIRGAKSARCQSLTPKGQLEGLSEKVEDWHALQAYYQVHISKYSFIIPLCVT